MNSKEMERQIFHAVLAVVLVILLFYLGRIKFLAMVFAGILVGSLVINLKSLGTKMPIADWFHYRFERDATRFPGYGSAWYAIGILIIAVLINDVPRISAGILIFGLGDSFSTMIGINYGKNKLPYNNKKSVQGTIAFFVSSCVSYIFIGPIAILIAALSAIVESLPVPMDDNLTVPLGIAIMLKLLI